MFIGFGPLTLDNNYPGSICLCDSNFSLIVSLPCDGTGDGVTVVTQTEGET